MESKIDQQPRAGEIVMICAHSIVKSAASHGAHLIKIPGGPRVFSNLDDRFFSEWLCFCDDCYTKACADTRDLAELIHAPREWIGDREALPGCPIEGDDAARDDERRKGLAASCHG